MRAGERLRLRPGRRPAEILIERDGEPVGALNVGRGREVALRLGNDEYLLTTGDGWDVPLKTPDKTVVAFNDDHRLRDDHVVVDGRTYSLELPAEDREGMLGGPEGDRLARLEIRHPEQGSVLLVDVLGEAPELVVSFAATIAYLRSAAPRPVKRFGQQHIQCQPTIVGLR